MSVEHCFSTFIFPELSFCISFVKELLLPSDDHRYSLVPSKLLLNHDLVPLTMRGCSTAIVVMLALRVVKAVGGRIVGAIVGGRIAVNIHGSGAVTDMGQ